MSDESVLILNSRRATKGCKLFLSRATTKVRLVEFQITKQISTDASQKNDHTTEEQRTFKPDVLFIIIFPTKFKSVAKEFWQHTGSGISSRFAEYCLIQLDLLFPLKTPILNPQRPTKQINPSGDEITGFVEERYGRNLDCTSASEVLEANRIIRSRISGVLDESAGSACTDNTFEFVASVSKLEIDPTGQSIGLRNRKAGITESCIKVGPEHVFLFPSGMASIFFIHNLFTTLRPFKTVQFGYPTN